MGHWHYTEHYVSRVWKRPAPPAPMSQSLRNVLEPILAHILQRGVGDEFQRGYAEAITWTWEQAGLPLTIEFIAVRSLARAEYLPADDDPAGERS